MISPPVLALAVAGLFVALPAGAADHPNKSSATRDSADIGTNGRREEVARFAHAVAERRQLDRDWVESTLARARFVPAVARLIMPPATVAARDWSAYRARVVESERVNAGLAFWSAHQAWLDKASDVYGVPPQIVVAVVGVETFFGRMTGGYRVIDALATLSFHFPSGRSDRSAFFRDELELLLVLSDRDQIDPLALKGSYAGAIGLAQFMPSSLLKYAVDFDGDGRIDLGASAADAIGSIANYLAAFGWQRGMPTHYDVAAPQDEADRAALLAPDIMPTFDAAQFAERGAVLSETGRLHEGPLALVELPNGSAPPSYVAGTSNFYTITRYNWSSSYAMAVIDLARTMDALRGSAISVRSAEP